MRASHRCDTCQGSGLSDAFVSVSISGAMYRCFVCNGSGTLPDQMPVADALADAEMLLAAAFALEDRRSRYAYDSGLVSRIDLLEAQGEAFRAINPAWSGEESKHGSMAARAAFRAVPALRGE